MRGRGPGRLPSPAPSAPPGRPGCKAPRAGLGGLHSTASALPLAWQTAGTRSLQAEQLQGLPNGATLTPLRCPRKQLVSDPLPSAELEDGVLGGDGQTWVQMSTLPLTRVTPGNS